MFFSGKINFEILKNKYPDAFACPSFKRANQSGLLQPSQALFCCDCHEGDQAAPHVNVLLLAQDTIAKTVTVYPEYSTEVIKLENRVTLKFNPIIDKAPFYRIDSLENFIELLLQQDNLLNILKCRFANLFILNKEDLKKLNYEISHNNQQAVLLLGKEGNYQPYLVCQDENNPKKVIIYDKFQQAAPTSRACLPSLQPTTNAEEFALNYDDFTTFVTAKATLSKDDTGYTQSHLTL